MSLNPGIYGCQLASPACANCYAMTMAARLATMPHTRERYKGATNAQRRWTGQVVVDFDQIAKSFAKLPKRAPKKVFVTSMSDLFHADVPNEFIDRVFAEMAVRPHITFQVLTKRAERAARWFAGEGRSLETTEEAVMFWGGPAGKRLIGSGFAWDERGPNVGCYAAGAGGLGSREEAQARIARLKQRRAWPGWPLPNVWLGCTVENQEWANRRIPSLLSCPAAVHFLSCEPLLGRVDLRRVELPDGGYFDALTAGPHYPHRIGWVITGDESGRRRRHTDLAWIRSLRDQCVRRPLPTPFFLKQLHQAGKKFEVPELDGQTWTQFPAS